ncbi:hypothetical protein AMECASPLE_015592, partial [Ameca splendens]
DGGWDEWSEWTVCSSQCERQRSRECNSPAPRHRGKTCEGNSKATENCTDGMCTQNRKLLHDVKPQTPLRRWMGVVGDWVRGRGAGAGPGSPGSGQYRQCLPASAPGGKGTTSWVRGLVAPRGYRRLDLGV